MRIKVLWMDLHDEQWVEDLMYATDPPWPFVHLHPDRLLQKLPWSEQNCVQSVTTKGTDISTRRLLSDHGILQLALWTTDPFYGAPEGHLYDKTRKPLDPDPCPQYAQLIDALADALLHYEWRCRGLFNWERCQAWILSSIPRVNTFLTILDDLHKKRIAPTNKELKYKRPELKRTWQVVEEAMSYLTENDFFCVGGSIPQGADPLSRGIKTLLITDLFEAFRKYGPPTFTLMATYRSLAAILNAFEIQNNLGGDYKAEGVKQVMKRPIDLAVKFNITHQIQQEGFMQITRNSNREKSRNV